MNIWVRSYKRFFAGSCVAILILIGSMAYLPGRRDQVSAFAHPWWRLLDRLSDYQTLITGILTVAAGIGVIFAAYIQRRGAIDAAKLTAEAIATTETEKERLASRALCIQLFLEAKRILATLAIAYQTFINVKENNKWTGLFHEKYLPDQDFVINISIISRLPLELISQTDLINDNLNFLRATLVDSVNNNIRLETGKNNFEQYIKMLIKNLVDLCQITGTHLLNTHAEKISPLWLMPSLNVWEFINENDFVKKSNLNKEGI